MLTKTVKHTLLLMLLMLLTAGITSQAMAEAVKYQFDIRGQHAFVQFKIKHLGYSWLLGEFNKFDGSFMLDNDDITRSSVTATIDTTSLDSNHAERDKHLKGSDFLDVGKYPTATFTSKRIEKTADGFNIIGELNLHGVTREITIAAQKIGEGKDPWGGYRAGFEGHTTLKLADFGINYNLGPASTQVELNLYVEGVRQ